MLLLGLRAPGERIGLGDLFRVSMGISFLFGRGTGKHYEHQLLRGRVVALGPAGGGGERGVGKLIGGGGWVWMLAQVTEI